MKKIAAALLVTLVGASCAGPKSTIAPDSGLSCDKACEDQLAVRALRETLRFTFNLGVQGRPAGPFDVTVPCTRGGKARLTGKATPAAVLGSTAVEIRYALEGCGFTTVGTDPVQNHDVVSTGTIEETGTIAVQPTATTDLAFRSDGISVAGKVFVPARDYSESGCKLDFTQKASAVVGSVCGRVFSPFPYGGVVAVGDQGPARDRPTSCDAACADTIALRALRETIKLAYNLTVQGKPIGRFDETRACLKGGRVRVAGDVASNATQGATEVKLIYAFEDCTYMARDDDPMQNYDVILGGTVEEIGTLTVQPGSTSAAVLRSEALTLKGKVFSPGRDHAESGCKVDVAQSGNQLAGSFCGRTVGVRL